MALVPNFCGAFYQALSPMQADETAVNVFTETREIPGSPKAVTLYGTPGLRLFTTTDTEGCRGTFTQDGRTFTVIGNTLYEIDVSGGGYTSIGEIHNDGFPVSFTSNGRGGDQLGIVGGDELHVYNLRTSAFTTVSLPFSGPVMIVFQDGYGLINQANSPIVWFSGLEDLTSWDALDFFARSGTSDNLVGLAVSRDRIWCIGTATTTLFYDSGDADSPFIPYPGTAAQVGGSSPWLIQVYQDAVYWIGQSPGGARQAFRATDPTPVVISTPPIDLFLQQVDSVVLATSDIYEQAGHPFFLVTLPESQADICTYAYDIREQMWHARADWNATTGRYEPWRVRGITAASGLILGGDRNSGKLYTLDLATYTNDGDILRRERTAPYLSAENQWLFLEQVELGIGRVTAALAHPLPAPEGPHITELIPDEGPTGTAFEIVGYNFGVYQGSSIATLNGTILTVTSWSATSIFTSVPSGGTTGPVQVTVNGIPSNEVTFTVVDAEVVPTNLFTIDEDGYTYNVLVDAITDAPTPDGAISRHPELVFTWSSEGRPGAWSPLGYDVVVFVHGDNWAYMADVYPDDAVGVSEPTWSTASSPGDTVVDGDVTWTNIGLWSAFPSSATTWQPSTSYTAGSFMHPTVPNGYVYTVFGDMVSGSSEPNWTLFYGDYNGDGTGYWMNMGTPQFIYQHAAVEALGTALVAQNTHVYNGWFSDNDETQDADVYVTSPTTGAIEASFLVSDDVDAPYNHCVLFSQLTDDAEATVYGLAFRNTVVSAVSPMYVVGVDSMTLAPSYALINSGEELNKYVTSSRPAYVDGVLYLYYSTSTEIIPAPLRPRIRGVNVSTGGFTSFDLDLDPIMEPDEWPWLMVPLPNGTEILQMGYDDTTNYLRVIRLSDASVVRTTTVPRASVDIYDAQALDSLHAWTQHYYTTNDYRCIRLVDGAVVDTITFVGEVFGTQRQPLSFSMLVTP